MALEVKVEALLLNNACLDLIDFSVVVEVDDAHPHIVRQKLLGKEGCVDTPGVALAKEVLRFPHPLDEKVVFLIKRADILVLEANRGAVVFAHYSSTSL